MTRTEYYELVKKIAREQRALFSLTAYTVSLTDMRRIYKHYGIAIMLWPPMGINAAKGKTLKGAYQHIEGEPTVLISRNKPNWFRVVTMAHELKHHLMDFELASSRDSTCSITPENDFIEKGAELFAVELIFPEDDFRKHMDDRGVGVLSCTPEDIARLKHDTNTTLSHASLAKRATFLNYAESDAFKGVQWNKLDESIYGEPAYKRILRYRAGRVVSS